MPTSYIYLDIFKSEFWIVDNSIFTDKFSPFSYLGDPDKHESHYLLTVKPQAYYASRSLLSLFER